MKSIATLRIAIDGAETTPRVWQVQWHADQTGEQRRAAVTKLEAPSQLAVGVEVQGVRGVVRC